MKPPLPQDVSAYHAVKDPLLVVREGIFPKDILSASFKTTASWDYPCIVIHKDRCWRLRSMLFNMVDAIFPSGGNFNEQLFFLM